jgi:Gas vesicle synthesis protein GvpL/GvpF
MEQTGAAKRRDDPAAGRAAPWRLLGVVRAGQVDATGDLAQLRFVTSGKLAAVLAPEPEGASTRDNLTSHASLVERLHARTPILPARYGILVRQPAEVVGRLLDPNRDALVDLLNDVEERDEVLVRAYQVEDAALAEVVETDPEIERLREATRGVPEEASRDLRLRLGERVAAGLAGLAQRDAALVLDVLRPLAAAVVAEAPATGAQILDASFLVDRARSSAFDQAVGSLMQRLAPGTEVRAVGPLPPYRFAEILTRQGVRT